MTNYQKAIAKAYETIDRMVELDFTAKEIAGIVTGMTIAFETSKFLTTSELANFRAKCMDRMV